MNKSLCVGIAGAGGIACGTAVALESAGHRAILWSPRRPRTEAMRDGLRATGAIEGHFAPMIADDAKALVDGADVVMLALPGYGHKMVMDAMAPHIRPGQPVIISSHSALGALYLGDLLAARGVSAPIVAWSTTVVLSQLPEPDRTNLTALRARVDICTLPAEHSEQGLALCQALFGDRFLDTGSLLAISLSNLNPQSHLAIGLCNLTRMELGENWNQTTYMTPMIARYIEALDAERLAIAAAWGVKVRTVHDHFHLSYHVDRRPSLAEMFAQMLALGIGANGPTSAQSRYVTEDVPFGLVTTVRLGELAGIAAPLHRAGIETVCALYGRDFWAECDLVNALDLARFTRSDLAAALARGTTTR